jgi:hypothetical protein
MIPQ